MIMMRSTANLVLCSMALLVAKATERCTKFETLNTFLINPDANRTDAIVNALQQSTADFICLQEVWNVDHMNAIINSLSSVFPYHFSALHHQEEIPLTGHPSFQINKACNGTDVTQLGYIVGTCGKVCLLKKGVVEIGECVVTNCKTQLKSLNPSCFPCIFLRYDIPTLDPISWCTTFRINRPGIMVLSRRQMTQASYNKYFDTKYMALERGYLETKLSNGVKAVCTHLSSNIGGYFEYDLDFDNYEAQQKAEVNKLNETFADEDIVLLGDLNMGPQQPGFCDRKLAGEYVKNYELILQLGYRSPYVTENGGCTYCEDNPLVPRDYPNQILDHVMVKGDSFITSNANRVYDQEPPISDHYGVGLKVCTK